MQEIRLAELHYEAFTTQRKRVFRANFRKLLALSGMSIEQLADGSGVSLNVLSRWQRNGISYDKSGNLDAVAKFVGLADPQSMFDGSLDASPFAARPRPAASADKSLEQAGAEPDRRQFPVIDDARKRRPEIFSHFTDQDWKELLTLRSASGEISLSGIFRAAGRINRNRELRHKFDVLLDSDQRQLLEQFIDLVFDATTV